MRVYNLLLTEANDCQYADLICEACTAAQPTHMRAAIAYATSSGVGELCGTLGAVAAWRAARKQWLVGIDYCRSDPAALAHLDGLSRSQVRIYDGAYICGRRGCAPRVSYHPKLYIFSRGSESASVVGSGNLSQTGLRVGVEAAASVRSSRESSLQEVVGTFNNLWRTASRWQEIADDYQGRYSAQENRRQPAPVEDDAAPPSAGTRGQLSPAQLRQLRVCDHLWIAAGNLHENRGPGRPGNQLMLKRNSRVFFGFQARELPVDTSVGSVALTYGTRERPDCSLRFSNNSMDVLTLPVPGDGGPAAYDQETLLFTRIGVRRFNLELAQNGDVTRWRRRSQTIGAAFRMSSGREWGVF